MEILLDFVYTETVLVTVENVQELLPAACLLQLKGTVQDYWCLFEFGCHVHMICLALNPTMRDENVLWKQ